MQFEHRGKTFRIDGVSENDHIYASIREARSFYEVDLLDYMAAVLRRTRGVPTLGIDVGANIGNHSVYFRSFLCDALIAVEPNPAVLPVLHRNLSANVTDCTVYECGLGARRGAARVAVPVAAQHNIGMARLETGGATAGGRDIEILPLDEILAQWQSRHGTSHRVSFLKIDVEGMERAVLEGAIGTLRAHAPDIFAEAATAPEYAALLEFLAPLGYRRMSTWCATPVHHFSCRPGWRQRMKVVQQKLLRRWRALRARRDVR